MGFLKFNLCFLYRLMVASVPLLEFGMERASGKLREYYRHHITEEWGHDEMLRKDLVELGVNDIPQYFEASMIAGAQYYLIAHDHPSLLLGYIHAMEVNAPKLEYVREIENTYGVSLSCMSHHAKADPWHTQELDKVIATLGDDLRSRIEWNERNTVRMFNAALKGNHGPALPIAA